MMSYTFGRTDWIRAFPQFALPYDPESYAGGSVVTGRVSHDWQVKGYDPDEKGYPGPPRWGLGVELTTSPRKIPQLLRSF
jgi:hypothetical protein